METIERLLKPYPVAIELPVLWGEMDAFQHVNNVVYFRYFESGRIAYLEEAGMVRFMERSGIGPILASVGCRFRVPLTYPDTVSVAVRVTEVGEDRFTMEHAVISHKLGKVAAIGEGVIVTYDYRARRKVSLPDEVRQMIAAVEGSLPKGGR